MIQITIPGTEFWDEEKCEFVCSKTQTLCLEHSLVSLSKWESKWQKPFLTKDKKTSEEEIDYIRCMTLTQNVDPLAYHNLSPENYKAIRDYIDSPRSATIIKERVKGGGGSFITSELIYSWMVALNIPFECQKWHLNRLLTLIRICNINNDPKKQKRSKRDILTNNAMLNKARKEKLGTSG